MPVTLLQIDLELQIVILTLNSWGFPPAGLMSGTVMRYENSVCYCEAMSMTLFYSKNKKKKGTTFFVK